MPRTIFLYVLLIGLFTMGCGLITMPEPLKTPTVKAPALDGEWTINMAHTGGIMGLSRSIKVSSDGKFTVIDERANKTVTGELSADELSKLQEQASTFAYTPPTPPDGLICADCFIYTLEIQGSGENFSVQLNDISLPNSGLESLVIYLRNLIDIKLKS
jgi:hypothetical protein